MSLTLPMPQTPPITLQASTQAQDPPTRAQALPSMHQTPPTPVQVKATLGQAPPTLTSREESRVEQVTGRQRVKVVVVWP